MLTRAAALAPLATALAQEPSSPAKSSREEDLKSARDAMANNSAQLAQVEIPIATEPAFVFKA